jgi:5-formyltetrahydrofolate cyclo-ligase
VNQAVVDRLFEFLAPRLPGTIAAYLAIGHEPDLEALWNRLPGWRWVLPRIEDDETLTFRDRDVEREEHRWGITQPVGSGPSIRIPELDVILVPALAFDRSGARLGRGGGYYDRVLATRRPGSHAIGVSTKARVVESIPVEPHDQPVDWLATEDGVRLCSPRS